MTTAADPVFVDTNILVHSRIASSPFHAAAVAKLEGMLQAGTPMWGSRQILREFASTLTRPQSYRPHAAPIADVIRDIRYFEATFTIADETAAVSKRWTDLLEKIPCGGKQVHDANIVATMLVHGVPNLLSHNTADFQRFSHLITIIPLVP